MNIPKVSVVVPVYNVGEYVRKCIESVLAQSIPDWQLILVDDGSKDESATIIDSYIDDRITVIHKNNEGVTAARADGLVLAQAELFSVREKIVLDKSNVHNMGKIAH